ncbi:MAG: ATP-binding protein [Candidatus Limnocylindria bacterium]
MRAPHYFLHGNLVWRTAEDVWAAYLLDGQSYPGLSLNRKVELKERIEAFAYGVETDFQIVRSAREWSAAEYAERAATTLDPRRGHAQEFGAYLSEHRRRLESRGVVRPELYLFVRLGPPAHAAGAQRFAETWRELTRSVGLKDARAVGRKRMEELRRAEERAFDRVFDGLPCERARSGEVAYLVRSAYTRGVGEPRMDRNWRPQAIYVESEDGSAGFEPYEHDLHRLHESRVTIQPRSLRVEGEAGTSHQALLVVGALPDEALFPGADVELLFSPLECGFPVDAVFTAEWLPNRSAQKLAQKRMVDADQQASEESFGEHGPTVGTTERTYAARELQARLGASDRPPFLRSAITLCVGADSNEQLEERVDRLRSEYGRVELHRPLGEQHRLFLGAMPAQPFPARDYLAHLLPEQLGAMVPTAISHAGSEIGPYLGYGLTGSRPPVQLDLAEASRTDRPPTVLLTGSLGSGKTIALETLLYQAYLQGSSPIVDIDPKGDHRLDRLPGVADSLESIELGPDERYRGLLDPMRVGTDETRQDLAYGFLLGILPDPVPAEWRTKIRRAVAAVDTAGGRTTGEILSELRAIGAEDCAEALEVHLEAGLAKLGYGRPGQELPEVGSAQVVSLRIRNLVTVKPDVRRSELQEDERVSQAVLRLVAAYALRLCSADSNVHSVLALDEAWALLSDTQGQALLDRLARMGRSMSITPLLASQIVGDSEALEPLVGTYLAFGVETEAEAERALELLRLDPDDESLRQRLISFRAGRCYLRDVEGRAIPMRIDPGEELLCALGTTPKHESSNSSIHPLVPQGVSGEDRGEAGDAEPAEGT